MYDKEVNEALYMDKRYNTSLTGEPKPEFLRWNVTETNPFIYRFLENGTAVPVDDADVYYPAWQVAPSPDYSPFINVDLNGFEYFSRVIEGMLETDRPVLTEIDNAFIMDFGYDRRFSVPDLAEPHSYLMQPVYDSLKKDRKAVAVLLGFFRWGNFFENVLPEHEKGIIVVVYGSCNQTFSYEMIQGKPTFLGNEDFHDPSYDGMGVDFEIAPFNLAQTDDKKYCQYNARIFPSDPFRSQHFTNNPYYFATAVVACFAVTTLVFVVYDFLVTKRQKRVMEQATKTTKIVNAMYPANVRQRLMDEASSDSQPFKNMNKMGDSSVMSDDSIFGSKPIADLFDSATILFADLVGFTAWSSVREPTQVSQVYCFCFMLPCFVSQALTYVLHLLFETQVFQLLETIYHKFDCIAKRMRVFKGM